MMEMCWHGRHKPRCPYCRAQAGEPSTATARRTDPDTSHEAAASVLNAGQVRAHILSTLSSGALTDGELFDTFKAGSVSPSGARTRRAELVKAGLVRRAAADGVSVSGRRAARWERNS